MKTIEQKAQECAARCLMEALGANNVIERRADYLALVPLIAASMREVCEPLEREAKAQGEHAVAMTEYAQSLKAALDVAEGALISPRSDALTRQALACIAEARKGQP